MFPSGTIFEYLSSQEGINKIILAIIICGSINAIFIIYSVRTTYGIVKKDRENLAIQQAKIDRLYPKNQ
tara:strand:+ start:351 stop:557 length:207 start_codon:yes stop_codon:yes gene_type:complete